LPRILTANAWIADQFRLSRRTSARIREVVHSQARGDLA
jgi:hypothetical protein